MNHQFTLVLSGVTEITAELADGLYEATGGKLAKLVHCWVHVILRAKCIQQEGGLSREQSGSRWTIAVAHKLRFHSDVPDDLANDA